jgi:hypothetical protein
LNERSSECKLGRRDSPAGTGPDRLLWERESEWRELSLSRPRGSSPERPRESRERRTTRDVAGSHSTWVQLHGVASDSVHVARAAFGSVMADLKTIRDRTSSFNGTGSSMADAMEQSKEKSRRIGSEALIGLVSSFGLTNFFLCQSFSLYFCYVVGMDLGVHGRRERDWRKTDGEEITCLF